MKTPTKLAIRLPNWVGDAVMALPTIDALAKAGFDISLYGKGWIHSLFAAYPYSKYTLPQGFLAVRQLWTESESKHVLLLTNSLSSAARVFFAGKKAVGYQTDVRRFLLSSCVAKPKSLHEVEYFWHIGKHVATQLYQLPWPNQLAPNVQLQMSEQANANAEKIIQQHHLQKPFIVLCPGAVGIGDNEQSKIWPYWSQLAADLIKRSHRVIVCPGPGEEKAFRQLLPQSILCLDGLPLDTYAVIMSKAAAIIANDSGPMHIAAAVGAPVLGIFGATSPQRTRPWGGDYLVGNQCWPTVEAVMQWLNIQYK